MNQTWLIFQFEFGKNNQINGKEYLFQQGVAILKFSLERIKACKNWRPNNTNEKKHCLMTQRKTLDSPTLEEPLGCTHKA